MARPRFLKLERGKVDAAFGMDRALAGHASPAADRDVDIRRSISTPRQMRPVRSAAIKGDRLRRKSLGTIARCQFIAKYLCHSFLLL
jgi:hypothetical protein